MWWFYSTTLHKWLSGAQPALSPGLATCKWWIIRNIKYGIELKRSLHYTDPATACSGGTRNVNVLWRKIYAASTVTNFKVDVIALKHNAKQKSKQIFCDAGIVIKKTKKKKSFFVSKLVFSDCLIIMTFYGLLSEMALQGGWLSPLYATPIISLLQPWGAK